MVKTLKRKRPNTPSSSGSPAAGPVADRSPDHLGVSEIRPEENVDHVTQLVEVTPTELSAINPESLTAVVEDAATVVKVKVPIFKDPNFVHSSKSGQASKKSRVWKNLKQIITAEKVQSTGPNDVTYATIDAPPSLFPAKKYSDISGLPAKYTDPQTKLRYASAEEFARIRMLPADVVAAYLAVRKASAPVS